MAKPSEDRFATVTAFVEALTGKPLTVTRGQVPAAAAAADSPSAARRVATGEAFAQTMGSGNFGDSPVNPMLATMAPATTGNPAASNTSSAASASGASRAPGAARAPVVVAAPTVDLYTGPGAVPPERRRRSAGVLAAIALAGAAVVAGAVYVATHRGDASRPDDNPARRVAATDPTRPGAPTSENRAAPGLADPGAADPKAADPKAADPKAADPKAADPKAAGPGAADPKVADPKAADPKAADPKAADPKAADPGAADPRAPDSQGARKPAPKPDPGAHKPDPRRTVQPVSAPDEGGEGNPEARDKIKEAAAALDRHEYDLAERLANAVINSPAGPKQRATARLIHGTVQCVARNDQEAAQIDLRNLESFHALKTRLLNVCRSHGILSAP